METLIGRCLQCGSEMGRFVNLWTQIGKNYVTPIVAPGETRTITTKGPTRVGDENTLVSGCQLQDIACMGCDSVLGLKCCYSPVNHVLEDNQLLLRLGSVRLTRAKGGRDAKLTIKRFLKLKNSTASTDKDGPRSDPPDPHVNGSFIPPQAQPPHHQPKLDHVDLTGLQAYLESQRADINRIDSAGYQIVAAFDSAMDRVEREVRKLEDTMISLRRELDGNRDDMSSLKTSVDSVRKDTREAYGESRALRSDLESLRKSVTSSDVIDRLQDALAGLRQSFLDRESEVDNLQRELGIRKAELQRLTDDQAALKTQVDALKKTAKESPTPKDYAREVSALRAEVRQLRQEATQKPSSHSQAQNSSFSAKELDILTRNITKIGNRASQIETLQMEFQLFKSRMHRLEATEPPAQEDYNLPPFFDDEDGQVNGSTETPIHRRKRQPSASREEADEDAKLNKRLAFSSNAGEGPDPAALSLPATPPLGSRGAGRAAGAPRSVRAGATGRKVRGRGRKSLPAV